MIWLKLFLSVIFGILLVSFSKSQVAPPQAVNAGFTSLAFDQEPTQPWDIGYGTNGHQWNAGLWWYAVPPTSDFRVKGGVLTITATSTFETSLCTQFHDASGGTYFKGGYFEASISTTDWSAFWLYCAKRPTVFGNLILPGDPLTWTNEIDIMETDPGSPNTVYCTVHKNTSGDGGVPDAQNAPDFFNVGQPIEGTWHIYGCLWTAGEISWYLDNVRIASAPPFTSTWQPVQLILTAQPGGVNGSRSSVNPPITQVKWVRVWESASPSRPVNLRLTPR